jgi:hypothetical protein
VLDRVPEEVAEHRAQHLVADDLDLGVRALDGEDGLRVRGAHFLDLL